MNVQRKNTVDMKEKQQSDNGGSKSMRRKAAAVCQRAPFDIFMYDRRFVYVRTTALGVSLTHSPKNYVLNWMVHFVTHTTPLITFAHTGKRIYVCVCCMCKAPMPMYTYIDSMDFFFLLVKENIVKLKCTRQIWNVIRINLVMYQWLYVRFDGQSIECDVCVLHTNYCELLLSFDELQLHTTEPAKKYISCVNGRRSWTLVCMRERVCSVYARVYVCVSVCKSGGVRFCPKKNHASSVVVRMSSGAPHIWMS